MKWPEIFTALITPYRANGEVNPEKAAELALHLWGQGSGGFIIAGSTGEAFALSLTEREAVYRSVRAALPSNVPVWVGTGSNDTRTTCRWTEAAHDWGADGMLLVAPYYNRPPEAGLVKHFVEAARRTSKPVMIYDVPGRTGVRIAPEVVVRAQSQAGNIAAVKEAAGSIAVMMAMHRALPREMVLYTGDDALLLPSLAVGALGVVSVASHLTGPSMAALIASYRDGQHQQALALAEELLPLNQLLFSESNPIPLKWLLNKIGWDVGGVRPPLFMVDDAVFDPLWQAYTLLNRDLGQRGA